MLIRRLIIAFLVLWLPLQSAAAILMPFCKQAMATPATKEDGSADARGHSHHKHHDAGASSTQTEQIAHAGGHFAIGKLACDNCGICHLSCASMIDDSRGLPERQSVSIYQSALTAFHYPLIFDLPLHPPKRAFI
jgi:ferredoxin